MADQKTSRWTLPRRSIRLAVGLVVTGLSLMSIALPAVHAADEDFLASVRHTVGRFSSLVYTDKTLEQPVGDLSTTSPFVSELESDPTPIRLYMRALTQATMSAEATTYDEFGHVVSVHSVSRALAFKRPFDVGQYWTTQRPTEAPLPFVHLLINPSVRFGAGLVNRVVTDTYGEEGALVERRIEVSGTDQEGDAIGGGTPVSTWMRDIVTDGLGRLVAFTASTQIYEDTLGVIVSEISYNSLGQVEGYVLESWLSGGNLVTTQGPKTYSKIRYNDLGDVVYFEILEEAHVDPIEGEKPWQTNENGSLVTDLHWNYNMGYKFVPQVDGKIMALGGFFNGKKTVRLYDSTGSLLAFADVTAANSWGWTPITAVDVKAGETYTVAVHLEGSGGSYRGLQQPFEQTYGNIQILSSVIGIGEAMPTTAYPMYMFGQADIEFFHFADPGGGFETLLSSP